MTFSYFDVNMLNSKHHMQLGPDDSRVLSGCMWCKQSIILYFYFILIFKKTKKKRCIISACKVGVRLFDGPIYGGGGA